MGRVLPLRLPLRAAAAATALALLVSPAAADATTLAASGTDGTAPDLPAVSGPAGHVVAISVDGLNPRALDRLGRRRTPNLHRFLAAGASTLNARTSHEMTVTLPNHTGMVTSRPVRVALGGHGVDWNSDRTTPATVQEAAGEPVESVFSAVSAAGGSTALFASKTKFTLWQRSWPDDIDVTTVRADNARLVDAFVADLGTERAFRFLHLSHPDVVGHKKRYMSRAYLRAVERTDRLVGRVVRAVRADADRRASTTLILTADHGGMGYHHDEVRDPQNFRIPFAVRGPGIEPGTDLYALNPDRARPGRHRIAYSAERQPVRNSDLANLALDLLGLPALADSRINVAQDLDVRR